MAKDITDNHVTLQLFPGYSEYDLAIFSEFVNPDAKPEPGFIVDFLGSRIRATSVWKDARNLAGQLLDIPVPADFHAETIEWIGLLKAVRSARNRYVAMELGAGFGPWIVAGGVAARRRGIKSIRLYAVEGDPQHFRFLTQHFADNRFEPDQHVLIRAAVGATDGLATWPVLDEAAASESWGDRPIRSTGDYAGRSLSDTQPVPVVAMRDLVVREPLWDLIHIDIQGDEVAVCGSCVEELSARVKWLIVGTHSRKIDGDLLELMCSAGWLLEHEKPAKFTFFSNPATLEAMTTLDGTQVWRNPRFFQPGERLTSFAQEITSPIRNLRLKAGGSCEIGIEARNTGTEPWFRAVQTTPVNVGYRSVDTRGNVLAIEGNRAALDRDIVEPGQCCRTSITVTAPTSPGLYELWISMVQEAVAWFHERGAKALILPAVIDDPNRYS
jgi:FkbM family methyltransferase